MQIGWPPQNRYWTRLARHSPDIARNWLADTVEMLSFLTVLPVRRIAGSTPDFTRALRAAPVAGLVVGAVAGVVLIAGSAVGLPPLLLGVLVVAAIVAVTGALHEDALSDVADGFGGGGSRARKLEIMRDSRTGSFGAVTLILTLTTRIAAIAGLVSGPGGVGTALAAVVAAAVLSRCACVAVLHLLPPARDDGLGARAGTPDSRTFGLAMLVGAAIALPCLWLGVGLAAALVAAGCAAAAGWGIIALARAQIGGQTGDVAGAGQQAAECAVLIATAGAVGL